MAELVFWFVAAITIISAGFVVLNNQLIYSAVALLLPCLGWLVFMCFYGLILLLVFRF